MQCCGITRGFFRTAVIGGLAVAGVTAIVGPDRVMAGFNQARHTITSWVDDKVEDPVVIRQQLEKLQREYPEQIRELRGGIAEVDAEIDALERDREIARRVVEMTRNDLAVLGDMVDEAKVQLAANVDRKVLIKFQGRNISVDDAYIQAKRIQQTAINYQDRLTADVRDLELLTTQKARLEEQLAKLEGEYANFQNQVWQIERQIHAIERNDRLIELLEEREVSLAENDRWKVQTLEQLSSRLARVQAEHEATIEALMSNQTHEDYEQRVIGEQILNGDPSLLDPFGYETEPAPPQASGYGNEPFPQAPIVIEPGKSANEVASRN